MTYEPIVNYLEEEIGLSRSSASDPAFLGAISRRLEQSGRSDVMAYLHLLSQSQVERQALVQDVLVPETWFFRETQSLTPLLAAIRTQRWDTHPVRILSAPCSTGEEPYSVALMMHQHGISPGRYQIEGLDLSNASIATARRGVFHENSFRGPDRQQHQKAFFKPHPEGWKIDEQVRGEVTFRVANLLDSQALEGGVYHAIVCRNLLIYLSERARALVLASLHRALREDGLLILGVAEAAIAKGEMFLPHGSGLNPVFEKSQGQSHPPPPLRKRSEKRRRTPAPSPKPTPVVQAEPEPAEVATTPELTVELARQMADSGQLVEARSACLELLERQGPQAEAYFLLGLISTSLGNDGRAEEELRRAVYLDPGHSDALLYLALLHERKGDLESARSFRRRSQEVNL